MACISLYLQMVLKKHATVQWDDVFHDVGAYPKSTLILFYFFFFFCCIYIDYSSLNCALWHHNQKERKQPSDFVLVCNKSINLHKVHPDPANWFGALQK